MNHSPGRYQRLDLFMKVLRVLCPNLTAFSLLNLELREKREEVKDQKTENLELKTDQPNRRSTSS